MNPRDLQTVRVFGALTENPEPYWLPRVADRGCCLRVYEHAASYGYLGASEVYVQWVHPTVDEAREALETRGLVPPPDPLRSFNEGNATLAELRRRGFLLKGGDGAAVTCERAGYERQLPHPPGYTGPVTPANWATFVAEATGAWPVITARDRLVAWARMTPPDILRAEALAREVFHRPQVLWEGADRAERIRHYELNSTLNSRWSGVGYVRNLQWQWFNDYDAVFPPPASFDQDGLRSLYELGVLADSVDGDYVRLVYPWVASR